jgi:hypothetical protein
MHSANPPPRSGSRGMDDSLPPPPLLAICPLHSVRRQVTVVTHLQAPFPLWGVDYPSVVIDPRPVCGSSQVQWDARCEPSPRQASAGALDGCGLPLATVTDALRLEMLDLLAPREIAAVTY